jgi:hypothetical protein
VLDHPEPGVASRAGQRVQSRRGLLDRRDHGLQPVALREPEHEPGTAVAQLVPLLVARVAGQVQLVDGAEHPVAVPAEGGRLVRVEQVERGRGQLTGAAIGQRHQVGELPASGGQCAGVDHQCVHEVEPAQHRAVHDDRAAPGQDVAEPRGERGLPGRGRLRQCREPGTDGAAGAGERHGHRGDPGANGERATGVALDLALRQWAGSLGHHGLGLGVFRTGDQVELGVAPRLLVRAGLPPLHDPGGDVEHGALPTSGEPVDEGGGRGQQGVGLLVATQPLAEDAPHTRVEVDRGQQPSGLGGQRRPRCDLVDRGEHHPDRVEQHGRPDAGAHHAVTGVVPLVLDDPLLGSRLALRRHHELDQLGGPRRRVVGGDHDA